MSYLDTFSGRDYSRMTHEEKRKLIKSYQEDYHNKTGEYITMVPTSKWQAVVDIGVKVELWKLVKVIMDFTGWEYDKIYNKSRKEACVYKRAVIDFIAVHNSCNYNTCAKQTNRDHVTVIHSVKTFENRLETESGIRIAFYEIVTYVKDNYYLYMDQDISKESLIKGA